MSYLLTMGLEVHVELSTKTKLFCACPNSFGEKPNRNTCPACLGMPGFPCTLNKAAVKKAIIASHLIQGEIATEILFDKKSYFYPDLPSGYQITQNTIPICTNGKIKLSSGKTITIKQIHIEQDAGKLVHDEKKFLCDYNRAGVPLIEIVSNADFSTKEEVVEYLQILQKRLSFAFVSDCKMQEGSMRCDVNLSVRKSEKDKLGVRAEIKNMNSFKAIERAIDYEYGRHCDVLDEGGTIVQQTRGWDDIKGITYAMREKEEAHDYRYFPDGSIKRVKLDKKWVGEVISSVLEGADEKKARYQTEYGLEQKKCEALTASVFIARLFEGLVENKIAPKDSAAWVLTELLSVLTSEKISIEGTNINLTEFASLIKFVSNGKLNRTKAKEVLLALVKDEGLCVEEFIEKNNLLIETDNSLLEGIILSTIKENQRATLEYKNGSEKALTFFMGQIMKKTAGRADFRIVKELLVKALQKI